MYDNLLKAMGKQPENGLTYEEQSENYKVFSDLMKKGVKLQDLIDKANEPKEPAIDESLFKVMEEAVKDDPVVKDAQKSLISVRNIVIGQLCMGDCRYAEAYKDYKDKVMRAYTEKDAPKGK